MYPLPKRLSHCVSDGEAFLEGSEYISFLSFDGERRDYCPSCWEKIERQKGLIWRGKIPLKKEKRVDPDEKALSCFRLLKDPKYRFVLAIYLQRKKQLVQRTKTLFEIPETGEIFEVEPLVIPVEESMTIAEEIHHIIETGLEDHEF